MHSVYCRQIRPVRIIKGDIQRPGNPSQKRDFPDRGKTQKIQAAVNMGTALPSPVS
jgi:hypothetical protein